MNKENINNKDPMDDFLKEAIKTNGLEKPGENFMPSLMEKIDRAEEAKAAVARHKPIIPAKGWIFIASVIVLVFAALFSTGQSPTNFPLLSGWFNKVSLDFLSVSIPNIFLFGLIVFLFYFVVEIVFISRNFTGESLMKQK